MKAKPSRTSAAILLVTVASLIGAYAYYDWNNRYPSDLPDMAAGSFGDSAEEPLHWHPKVSIEVDGQMQQIPKGIGIFVGKVMDTDVSGMQMSPIHTHEDDGTIHMEQMKPETRTTRLGYLFEVWDERFDSQCIFEYCSGGGKSLRMFVNGEENFEFDDYVPMDKDDIKIVYG